MQFLQCDCRCYGVIYKNVKTKDKSNKMQECTRLACFIHLFPRSNIKTTTELVGYERLNITLGRVQHRSIPDAMVNNLLSKIRKFLSILNVPSFIYFFHHFIFILLPLSTWKSGLACFMQMFYFIKKPTLPNRAVQNKIIKCTFQVNKD